MPASTPRRMGPSLGEMTDRAREIFRRVVEAYLESGEPVGSRTLSRALDERLSPATIRNVMQDLELMGLLAAPHASAGRAPTQAGLRLFVDALLDLGEPAQEDQARIEAALGPASGDLNSAFDAAGSALSGLSRGAGLVIAPTREAPIKHIEVVGLGPERALLVLVGADGTVENRLFTPPPGLTPSAMVEASNFLNAFLRGGTLAQSRDRLLARIQEDRAALDAAAARLIETGLAEWAGAGRAARLIVRGRSNLLEDGASAADLEAARKLFDLLERQEDAVELLDLARDAQGVRVFLGSETKLFSLSASALVISPYMNAERRVIGAIGVIGPMRLNYARVVPIVEYTARLIGRTLGGASEDRRSLGASAKEGESHGG